MPEVERIALCDVPPIPADAASEVTGDGMVVYDHGPHRWRLDRRGRVITYIEYQPEPWPTLPAIKIRGKWVPQKGLPWKRKYDA